MKIKDLTKDPFGKYNGNELSYVNEVLDSENRESRKTPFVGRLEKKFSVIFGAKYAIAQNSGTSTLHSCLAALGVGAGDEVISPIQTVIMCGFATLHQNAIPVFADVEHDTFNIDPIDIERKITKRTKAIIAVHMHGLPAKMPEIMKISKKYNIPVIEDSAQCIFGKIDGKIAGAFGHLSSFSFETKKHLSGGEGGMVTTNDETLGTQVRRIAGLGYKTLEAGQALRALLPEEFQSPYYKRHNVLGWNYRMNELTAAVVLAQLERIDMLVQRRQKVAGYFLESIDGCDWIIPQRPPDGYENSYWTFTVRYLGKEKYNFSWEDFWKLFKQKGGDGFYGGLSLAVDEPVMIEKPFLNNYLPKNLYPEIKDAFQFEKGSFPVAEELQPQMMQFKCNYRNLDEAKNQAKILRSLIQSIEGK
jgi:perosamine synthetase